VTIRVPVAAGREQQFEERFRQRAGQVEQQPGLVRIHVLEARQPDTPYAVVTTRRDRAAFEAWLGSEDFKAAHRNPLPKEAWAGEGRIEALEVIIAAEAG
jgi:heme-degrading monooxygenase HmoA